MTTMRLRRLLPNEARAFLGGWWMMLAACGPDPEGKFDEFVEQTRDSEGLKTTGMGETTVAPTTTDATTTTGDTSTEAADINGDFLLAVSTVVDKSKPLQFVASNTVTGEPGAQLLKVCLQALTLEQGKVLVPRQPIGEPLCFMDLPIAADGTFTIDAGTVMVDGMANPITGANIVASLVMAGEIKDSDFYCGTVTGEVMDPPIGTIDGSTFGAVRLADKTMLPTDVIINCAKTPTVTDM